MQINIKCQRDGSMFPVVMHRLRGIVDNPIEKIVFISTGFSYLYNILRRKDKRRRKMWSSPIFSSISIVRISREHIFDLIRARRVDGVEFYRWMCVCVRWAFVIPFPRHVFLVVPLERLLNDGLVNKKSSCFNDRRPWRKQKKRRPEDQTEQARDRLERERKKGK